MELVKGISTGMRPILDDYLQWLMEEQAGENEKIKKKGMQAKLKRQGTLYSQVSSVDTKSTGQMSCVEHAFVCSVLCAHRPSCCVVCCQRLVGEMG